MMMMGREASDIIAFAWAYGKEMEESTSQMLLIGDLA